MKAFVWQYRRYETGTHTSACYHWPNLVIFFNLDRHHRSQQNRPNNSTRILRLYRTIASKRSGSLLEQSLLYLSQKEGRIVSEQTPSFSSYSSLRPGCYLQHWQLPTPAGVTSSHVAEKVAIVHRNVCTSVSSFAQLEHPNCRVRQTPRLLSHHLQIRTLNPFVLLFCKDPLIVR